LDRPGGLSHPMSYYERQLPHWQPDGAALFVTWRLFGSLPRGVRALDGSSAGRAFADMDRELDKSASGPRWLADDRVAQGVVDALLFGERELDLYSLRAWVLMVNHVHMLVFPKAPLSRITRAINGFSARQANLILGRAGQPFWQDESYDRWVRDPAELGRIVRYIERNPVAAGLVGRVEDWRWSSGFGLTK